MDIGLPNIISLVLRIRDIFQDIGNTDDISVNKINNLEIKMIIDLYGEKGLVFQVLATGFKEAHLQDKLKFDVVRTKDVGSKFKEAVKKLYNAKYLDDSDMIIRFAEIVKHQEEEPKDEETSDEETKDVNTDEVKTDGEEEKKEETSDETKEEVNEAETSASGADLKKKITDTVKRCLFQEDTDKVEIMDLEGYLEGYNVYFVKVSLKNDSENTEA
jgi:hypothetical protein